MRRTLIVWRGRGACCAPAAGRDPPQTFVVPACSTGERAPLALGVDADRTSTSPARSTTARVGGDFGVHQPVNSDDFAYWMFEVPADIRIATLRVWRRGQFAPSGVYELQHLGERQGTSIWNRDRPPDGRHARRVHEPRHHVRVGSERLLPRDARRLPAGSDPEHGDVHAHGDGAAGQRARRARRATCRHGSARALRRCEPRSGYSDRGGGVKSAALLVDGTEVRRVGIGLQGAVRARRSRARRAGPTEVVLDTRTVPDGRHTLQLALIDVAGNRRLTTPRPWTSATARRRRGHRAGRHAARHADRRRASRRARASRPRARWSPRPCATPRARRSPARPVAVADAHGRARNSKYAAPTTVFSDPEGA